MMNKLYNWIDERLDITPLWSDVADHEVPEHVNPAHHFSAFVYCFGGLTFFLVMIQILSGVFLTMYYVPDIINAYAALTILQHKVAFGDIVRGMHHWGASLVIVMMFLHTLRVFFTGSYKAPREMNWVVGMLIFFSHARTWLYGLSACLGITKRISQRKSAFEIAELRSVHRRYTSRSSCKAATSSVHKR